jgi:hypothetical protein
MKREIILRRHDLILMPLKLFPNFSKATLRRWSVVK